MAPKRKQAATTSDSIRDKWAQTKKTKLTKQRAPSKPKANMTPSDVKGSTKTPTASTSVTSRVIQRPASQPVRYKGKFDFYYANLPFLVAEYSPKGAKQPNFEAVYNKILTFQSQPDKSGAIALADSGETGMFEFWKTSPLRNPMSDESIDDPTHIVHGKPTKISLNSRETPQGGIPGTFDDGFQCHLEMALDQCGGCGMIDSVRGTYKMHRVWHSEDGKKELFEGSLSICAMHGPTLIRKRHGTKTAINASIWIVRARRDKDGKEIGLDIGDGKYRSTATSGFGPFEDIVQDQYDDEEDDALGSIDWDDYDMYGPGSEIYRRRSRYGRYRDSDSDDYY